MAITTSTWTSPFGSRCANGNPDGQRSREAAAGRALDAIHAAGDQWWPLAMARELDDAILMLRVNEPNLGLWLLKTSGDAKAVLACDAVMLEHRNDWLVRETIGMLRRTLARLDVSSRSMYAIIEPGSCFVGCSSNWRSPRTAATCWRFRKTRVARPRSQWTR